MELQDSVRQAQRLAANGDKQAAVTFLRAVVKAYPKAIRTSPSEWHEIQARWALAMLLEEMGRTADAAREYEAIAGARRTALVEARHGFAHAIIAAAQCHIQAGDSAATQRLAKSAARLSKMPALPDSVAKALPAIGRHLGDQPRTKKRGRSE